MSVVKERDAALDQYGRMKEQLDAERERFAVIQRQCEELHGRAQRAEQQLAAEREKRERIERLSNQLYVALREGKPIPLGFRLCDEVQHLIDKNERLSEQLLQAQAAIAEVVRHWNEFGPEHEFEAAIHLLEKIDIKNDSELIDSLWEGRPDYSDAVSSFAPRQNIINAFHRKLDKLKAEVRKPLVEALEQLRTEIAPMAAQIICPKDNTFARQLATIADALAKAKQPAVKPSYPLPDGRTK